MLNQPKSLFNLLRVFVIGSFVLFAITAGVMIYWVTQQAFNAKRITDAQVKIYEAQAKTIGQPTILEQHYYAPK
jgi:hypothetical protein